jgi:drug/metabolite transporter (DMT)-like permease
LVPAAAFVFLRERFIPARWVALTLIICGVLLVAWSG